MANDSSSSFSDHDSTKDYLVVEDNAEDNSMEGVMNKDVEDEETEKEDEDEDERAGQYKKKVQRSIGRHNYERSLYVHLFFSLHAIQFFCY